MLTLHKKHTDSSFSAVGKDDYLIVITAPWTVISEYNSVENLSH